MAALAFSPLSISPFSVSPLAAPLPQRPSPRHLKRVIVASRTNHTSRDSPAPNRSLASLHELTERIADLLHVGSIHSNHLHCPKDAPLNYLHATNHVVVVFGKQLIRDQLTVEYTKRIITLVKQIASGAIDPHVIAFTGGKGVKGDSTISEAVAGYSFFRNICEESGVNVSRFQYILEEKSQNPRQNLRNVIDELRRLSGPHVIAASHFTLVSTDYHLIRIQEVHRLSPRQSILFPLQVAASTWNYIFAAYPFCVSRDPATAFLGRAVVLANDLSILLVNLNGALKDREFIAKENLDRLNETFAKMREMYRLIDTRVSVTGGFRTDMRRHAETLELAIHNVREVHTLLNPLNETGASVPYSHLEFARELLAKSINSMRSLMDPDRVLRVHDRMAIIEDMINYVAEQDAKRDTSYPHNLSGSSPPSNYSSMNAFRDTGDVSFFDYNGGSSHGKKNPPPRMATINNEVTWRGSELFKGNGKKITRDGPNVVIMDSAAPPIISAPHKPDQVARRTVAQSDPLAGTLPTSLLSNKTPPFPAAQPNTPATTSRARSVTGNTRKPQTRSSTSSKKRKPSARKLASPAHGENRA